MCGLGTLRDQRCKTPSLSCVGSSWPWSASRDSLPLVGDSQVDRDGKGEEGERDQASTWSCRPIFEGRHEVPAKTDGNAAAPQTSPLCRRSPAVARVIVNW